MDGVRFLIGYAIHLHARGIGPHIGIFCRILYDILEVHNLLFFYRGKQCVVYNLCHHIVGPSTYMKTHEL